MRPSPGRRWPGWPGRSPAPRWWLAVFVVWSDARDEFVDGDRRQCHDPNRPARGECGRDPSDAQVVLGLDHVHEVVRAEDRPLADDVDAHPIELLVDGPDPFG